VLKQALLSLAEFIQQESPNRLDMKVCVDTVPILERLYGHYAGLGWIGKNTTLINPHYGSWFFLGEILTSLEVDYDAPLAEQCGTCTRCLDACPTGALVAPRLLDARRCVSYLTIENAGEIPENLRPHLGNRVFGCDRCQEVCPWNATVLAPEVPKFLPRQQLASPTLEWLCTLTSKEFKRTFNKSPVLRTKLRGLLRNTAVAIGNSGNPEYIPLLEKIPTKTDPLLQSHVTWALEQLE
jgi:epoxyqueuosine reductase